MRSWSSTPRLCPSGIEKPQTYTPSLRYQNVPVMGRLAAVTRQGGRWGFALRQGRVPVFGFEAAC
jgi:hypothetical protein